MESESQAADQPPLWGGLSRITNTTGVFACLADMAESVGFSAFALIALPASAQESLLDSILATNLPDAFLSSYDATRPFKTAPIFTRLRSVTAPARWSLGSEDDQPVEMTADNISLFSRFSLTEGLSVPLFGSDASRAVLCLFGTGAPISDRQMADLTLGAILAYDLYGRLKGQLAPETSRLSDREIQVLGWAANGKTSAEIATILSLSDHTVNSYLNSAMRKMDCVNRTQLVAKALRLRIIS